MYAQHEWQLTCLKRSGTEETNRTDEVWKGEGMSRFQRGRRVERGIGWEDKHG